MRLVILGAGGYGRTIADIAEQLNYEIIVLDDSMPDNPLDSFYMYIAPDTQFIPAFGNNNFRLEWIDKLKAVGAMLATIVLCIAKCYHK